MAREADSPRFTLQSQRRLVGLSMFGVFTCFLYWWFFSSGIPVWFGPSASAAEISAGRELFEHEWTPNDPLSGGDGLGPVFNAKSCVFCHFQGGVGGGGEVGHNATHFEVLPQPGKNEYLTGVLHDFSVTSESRESMKKLTSLYPIVKFPPPPPPPPGCGVSPGRPPFDPVRTVSVQSTALFGAGWIDRISTKAITTNQRNRAAANTFAELKLDFTRVGVGRVRTLPDGRVGKFGWKAQFATLQEFVAAACANELGLGNPMCSQAKPLGKSDAADVKTDLTKQQFRDMCAFVDTLPRPVEVLDSVGEKGKAIFTSIGCAQCHVPDMGGVKGVYSDFLLYRIEEPNPGGSGGRYGPEPPPENERPDHVPHPSEWKTPPLWGVANSAPYLHDGSAMTLSAAILAHGGDAKVVTKAFQNLSSADQTAVIKFLESLKAPPDATPVKTKSTRVASRR